MALTDDRERRGMALESETDRIVGISGFWMANPMGASLSSHHDNWAKLRHLPVKVKPIIATMSTATAAFFANRDMNFNTNSSVCSRMFCNPSMIAGIEGIQKFHMMMMMMMVHTGPMAAACPQSRFTRPMLIFDVLRKGMISALYGRRRIMQSISIPIHSTAFYPILSVCQSDLIFLR